MAECDTNSSPMVPARVAGLGYLIIFATGVFAEFFVRSRLIVAGQATATVDNIAAFMAELAFSLKVVDLRAQPAVAWGP
jgi:Domain of unknown function (DUF4386)